MKFVLSESESRLLARFVYTYKEFDSDFTLLSMYLHKYQDNKLNM